MHAPRTASPWAAATTGPATYLRARRGRTLGGLSAGAWVGIGLGVVVVAGGTLYLVRRRSPASA
ncbi:hypothetical protein OG885_00755 [Streptomyces sp. NBC_00028]|uniref:hypothetical protein n=1 Tax=Streptomyces sp. NBC_00028 TaxID=2975624 RepID=UPI003244A22C